MVPSLATRTVTPPASTPLVLPVALTGAPPATVEPPVAAEGSGGIPAAPVLA